MNERMDGWCLSSDGRGILLSFFSRFFSCSTFDPFITEDTKRQGTRILICHCAGQSISLIVRSPYHNEAINWEIIFPESHPTWTLAQTLQLIASFISTISEINPLIHLQVETDTAESQKHNHPFLSVL